MESGANEDGSHHRASQADGRGACRKDFDVVRPDVAASWAPSTPTARRSRTSPTRWSRCWRPTAPSAPATRSQQSDFFLTCKGTGSDDATKFNFLEAQAVRGRHAGELAAAAQAAGAFGRRHQPHRRRVLQNKDDNDWKNLRRLGDRGRARGAPAACSAGRAVLPRPGDAGVPAARLRARGLPQPGLGQRLQAARRHRRRLLLAVLARLQLQRGARRLPVRRPARPAADAASSRSRSSRSPRAASASPTAAGRRCSRPPIRRSRSRRLPAAVDRRPPPPFCTVVEWHRIERQALLTAGKADPLTQGSRLAARRGGAAARRRSRHRLRHLPAGRRSAPGLGARSDALGAIDDAQRQRRRQPDRQLRRRGRRPLQRRRAPPRRQLRRQPSIAFAMRLSARPTRSTSTR